MSNVTEPLVIDRPELLSSTVVLQSLSGLSLEPNPQSDDDQDGTDVKDDTSTDNVEVILALLQPLTDPETLAQCRHSTTSGQITPPDYYERLDVSHLYLIWRRALASARPIRRLTFDIALPDVRLEEAGVTKKLSWNSSLAIADRDILNMIHGVATTMRSRIKGKSVHFKALYCSDAAANVKSFGTLQKRLDAITNYQRQSDVTS